MSVIIPILSLLWRRTSRLAQDSTSKTTLRQAHKITVYAGVLPTVQKVVWKVVFHIIRKKSGSNLVVEKASHSPVQNSAKNVAACSKTKQLCNKHIPSPLLHFQMAVTKHRHGICLNLKQMT